MGASAESLRMSTEDEDPSAKVKRPTVGSSKHPNFDASWLGAHESSMGFMILELDVIQMLQCYVVFLSCWRCVRLCF